MSGDKGSRGIIGNPGPQGIKGNKGDIGEEGINGMYVQISSFIIVQPGINLQTYFTSSPTHLLLYVTRYIL